MKTDDVTTLIYETVHGSRAYGLARDGSDTDIKGVIVGPSIWYLGFTESPEQVELSADHVRFEARKFMRLAAAANPTILELLFTDPEDHLTVTSAGQRLLDARRRFLTKRVADTFNGYAMGQLKRIKTHRRWLLEPPATEPLRADFGLPESTVVPKDQLGAAETLIEKGQLVDADVSDNFLALLAREKRYKHARQQWEQYRSWLKHRNPERAALEAEHGYDTKHAMHLVRLQRMATEILETGEVRVRRQDREELLQVRDGAWSYDALIEHSEALTRRVAELKPSSALPTEPDQDALNVLCVEIVAEVLRA
ncbi:MAG: nucleotidyltransferase domain-containing protein [Myxococcales bacterium]|nr:nucleotidyltransferase domain-containing protein [Myxococcales bacterium]